MPRRGSSRWGRGRLVLAALVIAAGVYWWASQTPEWRELAPEVEIAPSDDEDFDSSTQACGIERWAVKTLSDDPGRLVMAREPRTASLEDLIALPNPRWHWRARRSPEEEAQYAVDAWIVGYRLEVDNDVHVTLSDERGLRMIAEFPHPDCVARLSVREVLAQARRDLWALLPVEPSSNYTQLQPWVPVRLQGVLFFDRKHGQSGQSFNGAELHPVLGVARR